MSQLELEDIFRGNAMWQDLWYTLVSRKLLIFSVALLTLVSAYVALQFMDEHYEAETFLLVKLGRENVEVPASVGKGGVLSTGVRKEEVNSEIQLLSSRDLIEATVDKMGSEAFKSELLPPKTFFEGVKYYVKSGLRWGKEQMRALLVALNLKKLLNDRDKAILSVSDNLKVEREKDSDVISVRVQMSDADLAVRLLDTIVQIYLDRHVQLRRDPHVREFFDNQAESFKSRLREIESLKEKIRSSDNISSVVEQRKLLLTRLQEIDNQIADDDRERKMLSNHPARPVAAGKGAADSAGQDELTSSPALEQLKKRVTELRVRRSELLRSYLADAQPVVNVDAEIASLENLLRQGLDAKLKQQRQQAAALELALSALNAGEDKLDVIERERALAGENYIAYSKRREEARITEEMDLRRVSNIAVLGAITRPIEPVSPRKLLIMGIGAGFGLLLGISLALLLEYMNDAVRTGRDLADIEGLPYLGTFRL